MWSEKEVHQLYDALKEYGSDYVEISKVIGTKTSKQCQKKVGYEIKAGRLEKPLAEVKESSKVSQTKRIKKSESTGSLSTSTAKSEDNKVKIEKNSEILSRVAM